MLGADSEQLLAKADLPKQVMPAVKQNDSTGKKS
jgi:hypothetical protein